MKQPRLASGKKNLSMEYMYIRYYVLLSLPYFDPVRFTVIDTLHNLYLRIESMYSCSMCGSTKAFSVLMNFLRLTEEPVYLKSHQVSVAYL